VLPASLVVILLLASTTVAQEPLTYEAVYAARSSGLSATAERRLTRLENGHYLLNQSMEVRVLGARLGTVEETSQLHYVGDTLVPDAYTYNQSGISSRKESVEFNWQEGTAVSRDDDEEWQLDLTSGVVDNLSFQLLLRQKLGMPGNDTVEIRMVDKDEVETHLYRVTGSEIVETRLGRLDTIKVERIRAAGSNRHTTFWLARDWHLLLVKFLQESGSGSDTELLLVEAVVDGQEVTPLP
jgi:hypothetical protein